MATLSSEASFDFSVQSDDTAVNEVGLLRIGPRNNFFQWSRECHQSFLYWWRETTWVVQQNDMSFLDITKQIGWDSLYRVSETWKKFHQAASCTTGEPVVMCQRCYTTLVHPKVKNTGTSALGKHLLSAQCRRELRDSSQSSISSFLQVYF